MRSTYLPYTYPLHFACFVCLEIQFSGDLQISLPRSSLEKHLMSRPTKMKRTYEEMNQGQTLEETVYEYIDRYQEWENGKGVGVSCDDLNCNIKHPDKPKGTGSEKKFVVLLRGMRSLIESKQKWKQKAVFQLKEQQQSALRQAKNIVVDVFNEMHDRLEELHYSASRVCVRREEFEHLLEGLSEAHALLNDSEEAFSSSVCGT